MKTYITLIIRRYYSIFLFITECSERNLSAVAVLTQTSYNTLCISGNAYLQAYTYIHLHTYIKIWWDAISCTALILKDHSFTESIGLLHLYLICLLWSYTWISLFLNLLGWYILLQWHQEENGSQYASAAELGPEEWSGTHLTLTYI